MHSPKPTLSLMLALLEVRIHKLQYRVLCWQHTRYLIIISQTITGLIVIGEILEHKEEKCQSYWQGIVILWRVFPLLHFGASSPLPIIVASQTAQTLTLHWGISPKDKHTAEFCHHLVEFIYDRSLKERRKGSERPLKGQCEWQGLLSVRIVFCGLETVRLISADVSEGSHGARWSEAVPLAIDSFTNTPHAGWKSMLSGYCGPCLYFHTSSLHRGLAEFIQLKQSKHFVFIYCSFFTLEVK